MIRLDKYLADSGIGTRSEVKKLIKAGRIKIGEVVIKDADFKVDPDNMVVLFDNQQINYEEYLYFMLNKPAGCVSATRDKLSDTVISFLEGEPTRDLFPVGRLDKDTEGLLLITNDGKLAHELLSPKKHVDKVYHATVTHKLSDQDMEKFRTGLDIGDEKPTLPAEIELLDEKSITYKVILREGRFHQVKRMFEALGSEVTYLKRMSMGSLMLDDSLEPGEYRRLTDEEIFRINNR